MLGAAIRSGGLTRARFLYKNTMSSSGKIGRFLGAGTGGGLEVLRLLENQPNRRFYALGPSYGCIGWYRSNLSWKSMSNSLVVVDAVKFCVGWGWILSLNWTYRYRQCGCGDVLDGSTGCANYLHICGRWKLSGGEKKWMLSQLFVCVDFLVEMGWKLRRPGSQM